MMCTSITVLVAAALASEAAETPSSIDAFCRQLEKYTERKESIPQIFADLSNPEADKGARWSSLKNKAELDRHANEDNAYTQAFVWKQLGGTAVLMYFTSPSGDWAEYDNYCYRVDGSLARSVSTLNTFNAYSEQDDDLVVSRVRTKHFAADGSILRDRTSVLNKKTGRRTKVPFQDQEAPIFKTLRDLPFASLLGAGVGQTRRSGQR